MDIAEYAPQVSENKLLLPITGVLENARPSPSSKEPLQTQTHSVFQTLDQLFPEQKRFDKDIKTAKQILGIVAWELSPEQLKDVSTETMFLCESWLDDYERSIFKGKTLKELLHEKGA